MDRILISLSLAMCVLTPAARADEGMWLFTNPPTKYLKDKYKFEPTKQWLEHVQKSSVRFNSGGSGSFVSADGLVMTNHHVGLTVLQQISKEGGKDYVKEGFYATSPSQEVKAEDAELNVLMKIEDVTERINAAVKAELGPAKAAAARRAVMAEIEKEGLETAKKEGIEHANTEVVTLYQGGQYHLYTYKKYTDVRLVFAPEQQAAFYGGDPDNFEYPRFDLDICFFRVYDNGKPVKIEHYLKWSKSGAADNELTFVSGHPGRTDRLNTVAELQYLRDRQYPFTLQLLYRMEVALSVFSGRSEENARQAKHDLFSVQNSRKAREGALSSPGGLLDASLFAQKGAQEKKLRDAAKGDPKLKDAADAWDKIAGAQKVIGENALRFNMLEAGRGFNSQLFAFGRALLRAAEERPKPNGERLREYRESALEAMHGHLASEEPIYPDLERARLANSLTLLADELGADNDLVKKVLAGKSPDVRAAQLIQGTKLASADTRKQLYDGGAAAVTAAKDPMIELARLIDSDSRAVRKLLEAQAEIKQQAYAQIGKVKFAVEGTSTYPDATFTLRLSFGPVKGYKENGKDVPAMTTMAGLYERSKEHHNKEPFDIPERWLKAKDKLNLNTPFNFVSTADIIGGNSGSPVINKDAELVGIIFDGNIQSLVLDFAYSDEIARAVSVHSAGIIEALRKVYEANDLADELTGKKQTQR